MEICIFQIYFELFIIWRNWYFRVSILFRFDSFKNVSRINFDFCSLKIDKCDDLFRNFLQKLLEIFNHTESYEIKGK